MTSRRIVVLPDPLGPMRVTLSPWTTHNVSADSTVFWPNYFSTSSNRMTGSPLFTASGDGLVWGSVDKCLLQSPDGEGGHETRHEEDEAGDREGLVLPEGLGTVLLGLRHHLDHPDA